MAGNTPPAERGPDNRELFLDHYTGSYASEVVAARTAIVDFDATHNPSNIVIEEDGQFPDRVTEAARALNGLKSLVQELRIATSAYDAAQSVAGLIYDTEFADRGQVWEAPRD